MRTVNDHIVTTADARLTIVRRDEAGHGGAHHEYEVLLVDDTGRAMRTATPLMQVAFQNGPIAEHGINGVTQEVLLAIVLDRLRSFQAGPFSSRENALAITKIEEGLHWLQQRTLDRIRRGVEGLSQP